MMNKTILAIIVLVLLIGVITADELVFDNTDYDWRFAIYNVSNISSGNYFYKDGTDINQTIDAKLEAKVYNASNFNITQGTQDMGNLTSIQNPDDGNSLNISEVGGANPLEVIINFTDVLDFNSIVMNEWYEGGQGHEIAIGLYDCNDDDYEEEYGEITDMADFGFSNINVLDANTHICGSNNQVSLRFRHVQNGIGTHDFRIDYVVLVDGFASIIVSSHDGLSGRDDKENHPWAMPTDASRNFSDTVNINDGNLTLDTGSIGIGISTPTSELHVIGSANVTDDIINHYNESQVDNRLDNGSIIRSHNTSWVGNAVQNNTILRNGTSVNFSSVTSGNLTAENITVDNINIGDTILYRGVNATIKATLAGYLVLDGDGDYINTSSFALGTSSLSAWVYLRESPTDDTIGGIQVAGNYILYKVVGQKVRIYYKTGGSDFKIWATNANVLTQGTWYHVVTTLNITNLDMKTYVDGVEKPMSSVITMGTPSGTITDHFLIGTSSNFLQYLDCFLDEVMLTNNTIKEAEALSIYLGGMNAGPYSGESADRVVSHWRFDDGTADDDKGLYNGTLFDDAYVLETAIEFNVPIRADSYLFNSPYYLGNAIADARNMTHKQGTEVNSWAKVNHSTYPKGFLADYSTPALDLVGGVQWLVAGFQQLIGWNDEQDIEIQMLKDELCLFNNSFSWCGKAVGQESNLYYCSTNPERIETCVCISGTRCYYELCSSSPWGVCQLGQWIKI